MFFFFEGFENIANVEDFIPVEQQQVQDQLRDLNLNDWNSDLSGDSTEPSEPSLPTTEEGEVLVSNDAEAPISAPTDERIVLEPMGEALISVPTDERIVLEPNGEALISAPTNGRIVLSSGSRRRRSAAVNGGVLTTSTTACVEKVETPRRKQPSPFGVNITPEVANSRATPTATPVKRRLLFIQNEKSKKIKFPTVVERLFGARERSYSNFTPRVASRTRKRNNSTPVPGQKKIDEMMDLLSNQGRVGGSLLSPNVSKIKTVLDGGKNDKQHKRH